MGINEIIMYIMMFFMLIAAVDEAAHEKRESVSR